MKSISRVSSSHKVDSPGSVCAVLQEMGEDPCTPKEEKQERLSRHKETMQRSQAEEEAHLLAQQRLVYDRSCRALKRRSLVRRHEFEQEQLREVMWFSNIM